MILNPSNSNCALREGMGGDLGRSRQAEMHWRYIALSSWHRLGQGGHWAFFHLADPCTSNGSCFGCRLMVLTMEEELLPKVPHHLLGQSDTFFLEFEP